MSCIPYLPTQHLRRDDEGVWERKSNRMIPVVPPLHQCYFHPRKDYREMIEAFTEFHVNNLNLLSNLPTIAYFPTTHAQHSLDI